MQKVSGFCLKFGKNYKKRGKKFGADTSASVTERVKIVPNYILALFVMPLIIGVTKSIKLDKKQQTEILIHLLKHIAEVIYLSI